MKAFRLVTLLMVLIAVNAFAAAVSAQDATAPDLPALDALSAGWNQISLGGDAVCGRGTPYSFFVRPANPDKLVVYFQGGGACWDAQTCKPGGTFDDTVDANELMFYQGIFARSVDNPLTDYSFVVVPYCTGDVHTGSNEQTFTGGGNRFTIAFNGFTNAQAVLDWTYANYPDPSVVVVTGSSAGSVGAVFNAPYVLDHYRDARAVVLGDGYLGIVPDVWTGFDDWGTGANVSTLDDYTGIQPGVDFTNSLYTALASAFPDAAIAEYTSATDAVQIGFYGLMGGNPEDWAAQRDERIAALEGLDNFNAYVGWGSTHTILATPLFYRMQVNGVRFRDWFADLVEGEAVDNVMCEDCTTAELSSGT